MARVPILALLVCAGALPGFALAHEKPCLADRLADLQIRSGTRAVASRASKKLREELEKARFDPIAIPSQESGPELAGRLTRLEVAVRVEAQGALTAEDAWLIRRSELKRQIIASAKVEPSVNGVPAHLIHGEGKFVAYRGSTAEAHHPPIPFTEIKVAPGEGPVPFENDGELVYGAPVAVAGHPHDPFFAGNGLGRRLRPSLAHATDDTGAALYDFTPPHGGQMPKLRPFSYNDVRIPVDSIEYRLLHELEPGESATHLTSEGAGVEVYVTHPPVPAAIAGEPGLRAHWVESHAFRVIKLLRTPENDAERARLVFIMRDTWAKNQLHDYFSKRALYRGRKVVNPLGAHDPEAIYRGVVSQSFSRGRTVEQVDRDLSVYFSAECDSECKLGIENKFAAEGLEHPREVSLRFAAIEQYYRDVSPYFSRYAAENQMLRLGNDSLAKIMHKQQVLQDLWTYRQTKCVDACRQAIRDRFRKLGYQSPEEVLDEIKKLAARYPKETRVLFHDGPFDGPEFTIAAEPDFGHGGNVKANGELFD